MRQENRAGEKSFVNEYERENVIGDPNQTFGVEIEFYGADANVGARAFYAGLASTPKL
jgi:hypothetical protein